MQRLKLDQLSPTMKQLNKIGTEGSAQMASRKDAKAQPGKNCDFAPLRETSSESALQKLCESELRRRGIAFLHLSPRAREKAGWPDLTFAVYGRAIAVELKTSLGQLSEDQQRLHRELAASGWDVRVIRSYEAFRAIVEGVQIEA